MTNEERMKGGENKSVKDWIQFSAIITGAILTVYALIWQNPPDHGLVLITYLIFISFPFFANTISSNSKVNRYIRSQEVTDNHIKRMMNYAEFSFGFGFTIVISALAILGYEYLKEYIQLNFAHLSLIALILPIVFLIIIWILCIGYSIADSYKGSKTGNNESQNTYQEEKHSSEKTRNINYEKLKNLKRPVYIIIELVFMVLLILDYFNIILII